MSFSLANVNIPQIKQTNKWETQVNELYVVCLCNRLNKLYRSICNRLAALHTDPSAMTTAYRFVCNRPAQLYRSICNRLVALHTDPYANCNRPAQLYRSICNRLIALHTKPYTTSQHSCTDPYATGKLIAIFTLAIITITITIATTTNY